MLPVVASSFALVVTELRGSSIIKWSTSGESILTFFALSMRFIRGVSSELNRNSSWSMSVSIRLPPSIPPVASAALDTVAGAPPAWVCKPAVPVPTATVPVATLTSSAIVLTILMDLNYNYLLALLLGFLCKTEDATV